MNITTLEALSEIEDGTVLKITTRPNVNNEPFTMVTGTEVRKEGGQVWIGRAPVDASVLNAALSSNMLVAPSDTDTSALEVGNAYLAEGRGTYFILRRNIETDQYTYLWLPVEGSGGYRAISTVLRSGMFSNVQPTALTGEDYGLAQNMLTLIQSIESAAPDQGALDRAREQGRRAGLQEFRDHLVEAFDGESFVAHEVNAMCENFGLEGLPPDEEEIEVNVRFSGQVLLDSGYYVNVDHSDDFDVTGEEDTCACELVTHDLILDRYPGIDSLYVEERSCRYC